MEEIKTFDCTCRKCGADFVSMKELDLDNDGLCSDCEQKKANIAKIVQQNIDKMRANRPPARPRVELPVMQGTTFINARDLL